MRSTFRILFYLKRNAPKSNGLVPVMCRITVNGKISQFSCKLDVDEKHWDVKTGRMTGRSVVALETNRMLDKIRVGINKAYQDICDKDNYVTAEKVRNHFLSQLLLAPVLCPPFHPFLILLRSFQLWGKSQC